MGMWGRHEGELWKKAGQFSLLNLLWEVLNLGASKQKLKGLITWSVYGVVQFIKHLHILSLILFTTNPMREMNAKKHSKNDILQGLVSNWK